MKMIEHLGIVQRIEGERAIVAMETGGCRSCGHGSSCGIGKMAEGRAATLLTVPHDGKLRPGDSVRIGLPAGELSLSALLGYLFPAFAMLLGAGLGAQFAGSDGATALGAMAGFLLSLVIARLAIAWLPGLAAKPQLMPATRSIPLSPLE